MKEADNLLILPSIHGEICLVLLVKLGEILMLFTSHVLLLTQNY